MSRFTEIEAFIQVAQTGSFTAAADRLGLSRPRVSQLLQRLEARLSTQLLKRTTRHVSLTPEGEQFLGSCRIGMDQLASAEANLKLMGQRLSGRVRINSVGGIFGESLLANALVDVMKEHPALDIEIDFSSAITDINSDPIDLVLRIGHAPPEHVKSAFLGEVHHTLCASPAFLAQYGFPETPEALSERPIICGTPKIWELEHVKSKVRHVFTPQPVWRAGNTSAQLVATESGVGIGRLLTIIAEPKIKQGSLLSVLPEWRVEPTFLWLLWREHGELPERIKVVRDHVIHSLRSALQ